MWEEEHCNYIYESADDDVTEIPSRPIANDVVSVAYSNRVFQPEELFDEKEIKNRLCALTIARDHLKTGSEECERAMREALLCNHRIQAYPYFVSVEYAFDVPLPGCGDLAFSSSCDVTWENFHPSAQVLVVELKNISSSNANSKRKYVQFQCHKAARAWRMKHPDDEVFGATVIGVCGEFDRTFPTLQNPLHYTDQVIRYYLLNECISYINFFLSLMYRY